MIHLMYIKILDNVRDLAGVKMTISSGQDHEESFLSAPALEIMQETAQIKALKVV